MQGSIGMGHRREKNCWKEQREMVRCSGQECKRVVRCRNWRSSANHGYAWSRRIEEAKAQAGL